MPASAMQVISKRVAQADSADSQLLGALAHFSPGYRTLGMPIPMLTRHESEQSILIKQIKESPNTLA